MLLNSRFNNQINHKPYGMRNKYHLIKSNYRYQQWEEIIQRNQEDKN